MHLFSFIFGKMFNVLFYVANDIFNRNIFGRNHKIDTFLKKFSGRWIKLCVRKVDHNSVGVSQSGFGLRFASRWVS